MFTLTEGSSVLHMPCLHITSSQPGPGTPGFRRTMCLQLPDVSPTPCCPRSCCLRRAVQGDERADRGAVFKASGAIRH